MLQIVCGRDSSKADPLKCCSFLQSNDEEVKVVGGGLDSDLSVWKWDKNRSSKPKPLYSLRYEITSFFVVYQTFSGHHGSVEDVIEIDGVLISAGADRTIKLWQNLDQGDSKNDDDLSAKKRAKREERGQVRTTGKFITEECIQVLTQI